MGHSQATKNKISLSKLGSIPWNKGKTNVYSKDVLESMRLGKLGIKQSKETIKKRVESRKGYKTSEETKIKIGLANSKQRLSQDRKDYLRKINLGKKLSEEHKLKIKLSMIGKKFRPRTQEEKRKISEFLTGRTGKLASNYKGGRTSLQMLIRSSNKNRDLIKKILKLDDYTCQNCFKVGNKLEIHHIKKFSKLLDEFNINTYEEAMMCIQLWDINNLITLCVSCHKKQQKEKITWIPVGHRCNQNNYYG